MCEHSFAHTCTQLQTKNKTVVKITATTTTTDRRREEIIIIQQIICSHFEWPISWKYQLCNSDTAAASFLFHFFFGFGCLCPIEWQLPQTQTHSNASILASSSAESLRMTADEDDDEATQFGKEKKMCFSFVGRHILHVVIVYFGFSFDVFAPLCVVRIVQMPFTVHTALKKPFKYI